ncbi:hypothetical protein BC828DRAFT_396657 [Blastocladiella britannica]|nr:hypothetical protein BC828DRAFT_396657 [Blastocladiella britannica]
MFNKSGGPPPVPLSAAAAAALRGPLPPEIDPTKLAPYRKLVRIVARLFFTDIEILILDILSNLSVPVYGLQEFKTVLELGPRQIPIAMRRLVSTRLVRHEAMAKSTRPQQGQPGGPVGPAGGGPGQRPGATAPGGGAPNAADPRGYAAAASVSRAGGDMYVLDYSQFVNVTRYLLRQLERRVRDKVQRASTADAAAYRCPACARAYDLMTASTQCMRSGFGPSGEPEFSFVCLAAHTPPVKLVEIDRDDGNSPELRRLNDALAPVLELANSAATVALPPVVLDEYRNHVLYRRRRVKEAAQEAKVAEITLGKPRDKQLAKRTYMADAPKSKVGGDLSDAWRMEVYANEAEVRAAAARLGKGSGRGVVASENIMPPWHRFSTVTGEPLSGNAEDSVGGDRAGGGGTSSMMRSRLEWGGHAFCDEDDVDEDVRLYVDNYRKAVMNAISSAATTAIESDRRRRLGLMDGDDGGGTTDEETDTEVVGDPGVDNRWPTQPPVRKRSRRDLDDDDEVDADDRDGSDDDDEEGGPHPPRRNGGRGSFTDRLVDDFEECSLAPPGTGVVVMVCGAPVPLLAVDDDMREGMSIEEYSVLMSYPV